jgi:CYTH domain-containing protein
MTESFTAEGNRQLIDVRKVEFLSDLFYRESGVSLSHEVERRFLINSLPAGLLGGVLYRDMTQVYVPVILDGREKEVRLRKTYNEEEGLRLRAVEKPEGRFPEELDTDRPKAGDIVPSVTKEEAHLAVEDQDAFDGVWGLNRGNEVARTRFYIPHTFLNPKEEEIKCEIHLDILRGNFEGLVRAEIEFESKNNADAFARDKSQWPTWLENDVTGIGKYKSKYLFKEGAHEKWKRKSEKVKELQEFIKQLKKRSSPLFSPGS